MNVLRWVEQTAPMAFAAGILLGFIWSPDRLSCLEIPLVSRDILENFKPLNRLQARSKGLFLSLWLILLSIFTGSLVYFLLNLSAGLSVPFNFVIQVLLSWQAFPLIPTLFRLTKVKSIMYNQGTLAGLASLSSNPYPIAPQLSLLQKYHLAIHGQVDLLANFYWLAFLIFVLGSWPFLFFYLAFLIQYRSFQLENVLFDFCLSLSINLQILLLRFYLRLTSASPADKKAFKADFLNYQPLLKKNHNPPLTAEVKQEKNSSARPENKQDQTGQRSTDQTEQSRQKEEKHEQVENTLPANMNDAGSTQAGHVQPDRQLNLAYLNILNQLACLSLSTLALLGLGLLYLRIFI